MCWPVTWALRDYINCRASELTDCRVSGLAFSWFVENTVKRRPVFKAHAPNWWIAGYWNLVFQLEIRVNLKWREQARNEGSFFFLCNSNGHLQACISKWQQQPLKRASVIFKITILQLELRGAGQAIKMLGNAILIAFSLQFHLIFYYNFDILSRAHWAMSTALSWVYCCFWHWHICLQYLPSSHDQWWSSLPSYFQISNFRLELVRSSSYNSLIRYKCRLHTIRPVRPFITVHIAICKHKTAVPKPILCKLSWHLHARGKPSPH